MKPSYYKEKFYPIVLSIGICIAILILRENKIIRTLYSGFFNDTFLTTVLTAVSIIFGFLLTAFSVIYQSDSKVVAELRKANRFKEFVSYNKTAVIWLFINIILTSLFLLTYSNRNTFNYYDYFVFTWGFSVIYSSILSYRFLCIFYKLI